MAFYVFRFQIKIILRTQFKDIGAFCKRKEPAGEVGGSSYIKPSVYLYSDFPECLGIVCIVCVEQKTICLLACNLNSVRIVHYQIIDVHKKAVVQTSILLHVHGFFKVFLESSKGGKSMLRSLQWNAQLIANPIL